MSLTKRIESYPAARLIDAAFNDAVSAQELASLFNEYNGSRLHLKREGAILNAFKKLLDAGIPDTFASKLLKLDASQYRLCLDYYINNR